MTYTSSSYVGSEYFQSAPQNPKTWLEYTNPEYRQMLPQWCYARDHYTGECATPWKIPAYLIRKKIGEALEAYEERVLLADYTPHFGAVVDSLSGMLAAVDPNATRVFGKGKNGKRGTKAGPLGSMEDPNTLMGQLAMDCDNQNNGWLTFWNLMATDLVAIHDVWVLVDGKDGKNPRLQMIDAERVCNWRYEKGVLVEVVVKQTMDIRTSIEENPAEESEEQYLVFDVDGWTLWHCPKGEKGKTGEPEELDSGKYEYVNRAGQRTLPIFRVRLPLKRNVGYLMARKVNSIFNKESERDHLLRFACFPMLNVVASDTLFKKILGWLRDGARVLQVMPGNSAHSFVAPDSGPAATLSGTITEKENTFYRTAFREFGSAARAGRDRVTATEIKSDDAAGIASFLQLLRAAVDNAENTALYLLEQTMFPSDPSKWGQARVSRSTDFAPFDIESTLEMLRKRYFGEQATVPVGETARTNLAKMFAEHDGLEADDKEIAEEVKKITKLLEQEVEADEKMKGLTAGIPKKPKLNTPGAA